MEELDGTFVALSLVLLVLLCLLIGQIYLSRDMRFDVTAYEREKRERDETIRKSHDDDYDNNDYDDEFELDREYERRPDLYRAKSQFYYLSYDDHVARLASNDDDDDGYMYD